MTDPFATGLDEDPAADFLAREQQQLAGLEDDGFGGLSQGKRDNHYTIYVIFFVWDGENFLSSAISSWNVQDFMRRWFSKEPVLKETRLIFGHNQRAI